MRKLTCLCFAIAATASLFMDQAHANTIEASFNNTLSATDSSGRVTRYYFNADHTYSMSLPDGSTITGTWEADDQQACLTAAGGERTCNPYEGNKSLGDTWHVEMPDGSQLTVAITAGR